jgi:hypothetical protein
VIDDYSGGRMGERGNLRRRGRERQSSSSLYFSSPQYSTIQNVCRWQEPQLVTLTTGFYLGVLLVTEQQWQAVRVRSNAFVFAGFPAELRKHYRKKQATERHAAKLMDFSPKRLRWRMQKHIRQARWILAPCYSPDFNGA